MRTIHKYLLLPGDQTVIQTYEGAKVLCVQMQHGDPHVWLEVDTQQPLTRKTFRVYGTGHELPSAFGPSYYVGTFQLNNGELVFHVYAN